MASVVLALCGSRKVGRISPWLSICLDTMGERSGRELCGALCCSRERENCSASRSRPWGASPVHGRLARCGWDSCRRARCNSTAFGHSPSLIINVDRLHSRQRRSVPLRNSTQIVHRMLTSTRAPQLVESVWRTTCAFPFVSCGIVDAHLRDTSDRSEGVPWQRIRASAVASWKS